MRDRVQEVSAAAPGRVNLVGEHTDYNDGWVLPIAIDRRARVTASWARDGHDDTASPYLQGVVDALRAASYDVPAARLTLTSDVPIGAGLSSSAALTCATALAIDELAGLGLTREQMVEIARRAENDFVGAPTGILDQSASLLCTADHALLLDCRDRSTRQVPLDLGELRLLVIDTGVSHSHADGGYGDRRRECEEAARALGVTSLREATDERGLDGVLERRARHIRTENARVHEMVAALEAGDLPRVGAVMTASHASMRDDFEISCPELDIAVDAAERAGALGARMTGGGFGGSAIALTADPERVASETASAFADRGWSAPRTWVVAASAGGRVL